MYEQKGFFILIYIINKRDTLLSTPSTPYTHLYFKKSFICNEKR